jgi:myo-inositol-1(or 4)-monophosphatase
MPIIGEELSPDAAMTDLVWVVDPLDGTTNYLHDYPSYAVSIAALREGTPVAGVVTDVVRDRVYTATHEGGAWCGDTRLNVSPAGDPSDALIGTGFPFKAPDLLPEYLCQFSAVMHGTSGIRRAGAAALDLVDVALGRFEGFWELHLAPWDIAAGTLLVREAGGVVTDTDGAPKTIRHGPVVAGNATMHAWLLETLDRCRAPSDP